MSKGILLIAFLFGLSHALIQNKTTCPDVKGVKNLDFDVFIQEIWYCHGRYPNEMENHRKIEAYKGFRAKDNIYKFSTINVPKSSDGYEESEMSLENKDTGDILFKLIFGKQREIKTMKATFILYQPHDYVIIYSCKNDEKRNVINQYLWIAYSSMKPTPESETAVVEFIKKSDYLDFNKIEWFYE